MKAIRKKQSWKLIFLLGPFLVTAGLTVGLVSGKWGITPLALLIPGIAIIATWLIWQIKVTNWWGKRSTQAGTNALLATLAVLVILGLINFLGSRYYWRTDLTETKLFSLAPQTQELLKKLPEPVKVLIFDVTQNSQDRDLLENYRRQSDKFKFEYIDPQTSYGIAKQFGVKEPGEVYLENNQIRKLVQVVNPRDRLSETRITNRLQQIISGKTTKVYFLQGHGEYQLTAGENAISQAVQSLNEKNFVTEPLNLAEKGKIPEDANVVVVASAKRALLDSEVKLLQDYLNGGGNVLLMIDPDTEPKLDPLLNEWGVKLDNRLVVDATGNETLGPAVPIVTQYGNHPITEKFGNGISFYRLARSIEIIPVNGVQATPLLITKPFPNSWAESDQKSEKLEFNEGKDRKGPLNLGVALTRKVSTTTPIPPATSTPTPTPTPTPTTNKESRLVVIGNSDFATDRFFQQQLNGDVFLNSVTWLNQQDQQPLSIRPKELKNRRINLSSAQVILLRLSSLLVLPFLGFLSAGLLWWQRR
ncbi:GldG family protein [Brunnivagina elsteri]|uniref:ABC transporter n=1 Tax=Brunnivagina elsteri CCALA 953 TaxID=987040 RepID=A0A2A2TJN5_9CYAN|nr:Gldg family protein [Calothrix elsteri]PAX55890.1 ABC transporter [Calothrix elsteri CCALA 953]